MSTTSSWSQQLASRRADDTDRRRGPGQVTDGMCSLHALDSTRYVCGELSFFPFLHTDFFTLARPLSQLPQPSGQLHPPTRRRDPRFRLAAGRRRRNTTLDALLGTNVCHSGQQASGRDMPCRVSSSTRPKEDLGFAVLPSMMAAGRHNGWSHRDQPLAVISSETERRETHAQTHAAKTLLKSGTNNGRLKGSAALGKVQNWRDGQPC